MKGTEVKVEKGSCLGAHWSIYSMIWYEAGQYGLECMPTERFVWRNSSPGCSVVDFQVQTAVHTQALLTITWSSPSNSMLTSLGCHGRDESVFLAPWAMATFRLHRVGLWYGQSHCTVSPCLEECPCQYCSQYLTTVRELSWCFVFRKRSSDCAIPSMDSHQRLGQQILVLYLCTHVLPIASNVRIESNRAQSSRLSSCMPRRRHETIKAI